MKCFDTIIIWTVVFLFSYLPADKKIPELPDVQNIEKAKNLVEGSTISSRFPTPTGFERTIEKKNSFGHYLRVFPLF